MRALVLLSVLAACTRPPAIDPDTARPETAPPQDSEEPPWDMSLGAEVYDIDTLHEVLIEIDPGDWEELGSQQRNLLAILTEDCLEQPMESPYTMFHADVTVDGVRYEDVGIRKKGLLGSESSERPSLKIRFDEYVDGVLHDGLDRLTLNNGRQDPAVISQCLGYEIFREAGLPASRCSFATVEVNGEPLGVYSNIEAMEPPLLARWYDDPDGRLWEGQLSDFREEWLGTFEAQEGDGDPAALEAVVEALEQPDELLIEALDGAVDLDQYMRFWAMEVLVGHWDGYAGNSNNFFVYQDPSDGRLDFLPWGIDALFDSATPFGEGRPSSVVAVTALPRRLYLHERGRDAYFEALDELLATAWDEAAIGARIDTMEATVVADAIPWGDQSASAAIDTIRGYVAERRGNIEAERAGGDPAWGEALRGEPCLVDVGDLPVTFSTTWGSYGAQDPYSYGSGSMGFTYNGAEYDVDFLGAIAGESHGENVLLVIGRVQWGSLLALWLSFPDGWLADGTTATMDWSEGRAYLYYDEGGTGEAWGVAAYLGNGPVRFEQASPTAGAPLVGSVELDVFGGR
jgi:hypothetical protein